MTIAALTAGAWPQKTSLGGGVEEGGLVDDMETTDVAAFDFVFKATKKKVVAVTGLI